jgi:hypothetical protein
MEDRTDEITTKGTPLIIGAIASVSLGARFITSTHRHVIRFEMPDETLVWRSPAIDFDSKREAARAVRVYARKQGSLQEPATQDGDDH